MLDFDGTRKARRKDAAIAGGLSIQRFDPRITNHRVMILAAAQFLKANVATARPVF